MEAVSRSYHVVHDADPRDEILAELHDALPKIHLGGPDVMLARYVASGRIKSSSSVQGLGLIRPDQSLENDKWGSCVGLIVKLGPLAFKTGENLRWSAADAPQIGDWVFFDPKHGQLFMIGERACYLAFHQHIFMKLDEPFLVRG